MTQPAHGTATLEADGTVTYRPAPGFIGSDGFGYTVSDGCGGTAQASVSVTVRSLGEPFSDGTLFTDGTGWIPLAA